MNIPGGILSRTFGVTGINVGKTRGAGDVKVGNLVGVDTILNSAIRVGSIVGVILGVGVGGGSTIGKEPVGELTKKEYTQATPLETPV